ncbi:MAG: hypothetical protein Q4F65_02300 [Propionibacteriaceae bacterium]|nr:hypothetical protein [Propionibacteriaceae bacterium]
MIRTIPSLLLIAVLSLPTATLYPVDAGGAIEPLWLCRILTTFPGCRR